MINLKKNNFEPKLVFPEFYGNPVIQHLGNLPKWTVSTNKKMPIDVCILRDEKRVKAAKYTDDRCLVTLDEICQILPTATSNTIYLDALTDGYVVLDIEPKCPDELKQNLLQLPYLYGEVSMSGKGYHLIFELPKIISKYPAMQKKIVLKEENGYYEILLNHYVTFTRQAISPYYRLVDNNNANVFETLFENMAKTQIKTKESYIEISEEEPKEIPNIDLVFRHLEGISYTKHPSDFNEDISRYEYNFISYFYHKIFNIMLDQKLYYSDTELLWLLYYVIKERIPHRDKHNEKRKGMPWLMYQCSRVLAKNK